MSAPRVIVHPATPQVRYIQRAAQVLSNHGVVVVPTDSCYSLAIAPGSRQALERVARLKGFDTVKHLFSLIVPDLSEVARFAEVDTHNYRILKHFLPGPYTFVLPATRAVPRLLLEKRKTIGLRVPDHNVPRALAREVGGAILATTLRLPGDDLPLSDPDEIEQRVGKLVDLIVECGWGGVESSTLIDLSDGEPSVLRTGAGDPAPFESN